MFGRPHVLADNEYAVNAVTGRTGGMPIYGSFTDYAGEASAVVSRTTRPICSANGCPRRSSTTPGYLAEPGHATRRC